jgi:hypothetical protein
MTKLLSGGGREKTWQVRLCIANLTWNGRSSTHVARFCLARSGTHRAGVGINQGGILTCSMQAQQDENPLSPSTAEAREPVGEAPNITEPMPCGSLR